MASQTLPSLPNIEALIDGEGEITIGYAAGLPCTATAVDEGQCLAMLVGREGGTLVELLSRLEAAIHKALEEQIYIDEINNRPDDRI